MMRFATGLVVGFLVLLVGTAEVRAGGPAFALGFVGPSEITGPAESTQSAELTLTMTPSGDLGGRGAQGWSISLSDSGCADIAAITTAGTVAADVSMGGLRNTGFEVSELTTLARAGSGCEGRTGAVSAVVLSFIMPITLPAAVASNIAIIEVNATIPAEGEASGSVEYVNGCRGSGQPVDNNVTWMGQTIVPTLGTHSITCSVSVSCDGAPLNLIAQAENLRQVSELNAGLLTASVDDDASIDVFVAPGVRGATSVYAGIVSNLESGVQGWSLAASVSGDVTLRRATTAGTVAADVSMGGLRNTGFEVSELINAEREPSSGPLAGMGPQGQGAVTAIVLSFIMPITLNRTGTATVWCLEIEANAKQGPETQSGRVEWRDGLQGSGQPVATVATVAGTTAMYCRCQAANVNFIEQPDPRRPFLRGDSNDDARIDIADGVWIINELFRSGPESTCFDAADANNDGMEDLTDAVHIIDYQFRGGAPPSAPFPDCGKDGGDDGEDDDDVICDQDTSAC